MKLLEEQKNTEIGQTPGWQREGNRFEGEHLRPLGEGRKEAGGLVG